MHAAVVCLDFSKSSFTWGFQNNQLRKTLTNKKAFFKFPTYSLLSSSLSSPITRVKTHNRYQQKISKKHANQSILLVDNHENQKLKSLLKKLHTNSTPVEILRDEGNWSENEFWFVMRFLKENSQFKEILQVFDLWKNLNKSEINEVNYEKIVQLLGEVGLMKEAVSVLREMKYNNIILSLKVYNSIIHGFARKGEFEQALKFVKEMVEFNLKPKPETYNGLILAYANYGMYDEMGKCVKRMESEGCVPDDATYNLLVVEFARAGLLKRMERAYLTLLSKKMIWQTSTLIAMLEAYANLGLLEDMEKVYRRVLKSKAPLKEGMIRKMARVYVENYMFSRLEELGDDIASRTGGSDFVWCLKLLSQACILSQRGMESIIQSMQVAEFSWNTTVVNIMALAYLKMKNFRQLNVLLSQLETRLVKPDIVTVGVLFDANAGGFDESGTIERWRRIGLLKEAVEMNTDPLVLTAFRKGYFLRSCEEMYSALGQKSREKEVWTYHEMIDMVFKHNGRKSKLLRVRLD